MSLSLPFDQLKLRFTDPIQHDYEVIRPIVLLEETVSERSQDIGMSRSTVGDKARRFVQKGMLGLIDQRRHPSASETLPFPDPIAAHILFLKQYYPPIHYREIVRIVERKFGYQTNHHTVKRFLDRQAIPLQLEWEFPTFHDFEDAYHARWTVVKMAYEGWNKKSIAGCLRLSRKHVHHIVQAFEQDGFAGLEDQRTRPPDHPANQLTLPLLKEILDLQEEFPRAGRYRIAGLLEAKTGHAPSERTVGHAMALNRAFHEAPGAWQSAQNDLPAVTVYKHMPYRPRYRHQLWFVDLRYLVQLESGWVYSVCIIEGYSRKILAGMVSAHQDLIAILQILKAALASYGCPERIVSDNGAVFLAHDYQRILAEVAVEPLYIEKGKPWQNLIEAQFKIQLRLLDAKIERATTLEQVQDAHAEFVQLFNTTRHAAHEKRRDQRHTPEQVLQWAQGRVVAEEQLHALFRSLQCVRTINRFGFVSVQRFYIYAERGLARHRVSIWIYENRLHIEYEHTQLARYRYAYNRKRKRLADVSEPTLYTTAFASPQLELFELDHEQWLKVHPRPYQRQPERWLPDIEQLSLLQLASLIVILRYLLASTN